MNCLYITRKYPPSIGGMEKMNQRLIAGLSERIGVDKITWGYSQVLLPIFMLKVFAQVLFYLLIKKRAYDLICIGDAMLSPLGLFLKKIMHLPVVSIAHGLDITFSMSLYQKIAISSLRQLDMVICVSSNTRDEAIKRGIDRSRIRVIPNGVDIDPSPVDREGFIRLLKERGLAIRSNSRILLTAGRLIKRKGIAEFIKGVFARIAKEKDLVYIIVGEGKERKDIEAAISENGLKEKVLLLGRVEEGLLCSSYACSDIFVMPNIRVEGDVEGFGIVGLEASSYGLPVIASDIEGIKDVVKDGENGFLVSYDNPESFREKILYLLQDDEARLELSRKAKLHAKSFSWQDISSRYVEAFEEILSSREKRILMVSRPIGPPWDEASRNMVRDITAILKEYRFHILTSCSRDRDEGNIVSEKVYSSRKNTLLQKMRLLLYLAANRKSFDLYHFCFTPEPLTSFLSKLLIKKDRKIWSVPYISSSMSKRTLKALGINTSAITVTSEYTKEILKRESIDNIELIYPGIDLKRFRPADDTKKLKEKLGITGNFNILYAGDLTTDSAATAIKSIIKETIQNRQDASFVITSRIKKRADMARRREFNNSLARAGLGKKVLFMDRVEDMAQLIKACEVLIYPWFEGFDKKIDIPYVVVEAMACGKPVLISDKRPLKEALKGEAGIAVKADTPHGFSKAIIELLRDERLARSIGSRNRQVAEEYFDIRKNVRAFASLYNAILNN